MMADHQARDADDEGPGGTQAQKSSRRSARGAAIAGASGRTVTSDLASVIALDIVPALLTQYAAPDGAVPRGRRSKIPPSLPLTFLRESISGPVDRLLAIARAELDAGVPLETLLLDLLAPVAKQLGVLWERDEITFLDVTMAVQKLQHVLQTTGHRNRNIVTGGPCALLLQTPGETHNFGLGVFAELLRRRGWTILMPGAVKPSSYEKLCATNNLALIGYSVSGDALLPPLTSAIRQMRKALRGQTVILAGGRVFDGRPELAEVIGADVVVSVATEAFAVIDQLSHIHATRRE